MMNLKRRKTTMENKRESFELNFSRYQRFLVLAVLLTVAITFSKYITTVNESADTAVAKFNVSAADGYGSMAEITLDEAGETSGTYSFTVTNNSEVDLKHSIIVKGVPSYVDVTMSKGATVVGIPSVNHTIVTIDAGELAKGQTSYILNFALNTEAENFPQKDISNLSVSVEVQVEQVD